MAEFTSLKITKYGEEYLSRILVEPIDFTTAIIKLSTQVVNPVDIFALTTLNTVSDIAIITQAQLNKATNTLVISARFNNLDIKSDIIINTIGLFISNNGKEKLIAATTATEPLILRKINQTAKFYNLKLSLNISSNSNTPITITDGNFASIDDINRVVTQLEETMNKTAVTLNHQFENNTERDNYFTNKPDELSELTFIKVGTGYQQYINSTWESSSPVLTEAVNQIDDEQVSDEKTWSSQQIDDKKADKKQEDWITPTLLNGWTTYTDTSVQYRKDEFGVVRFRGRLNPATKTNIHFMTMPNGYRPVNDTYINFGSDTFMYFGKGGACQSYFSKWQSLEGLSFSTI